MGRFCAAAKRFFPVFAALFAAVLAAPAAAETYPLLTPPKQEWSFAGIFGAYDKAQLQRGLKVFTETCSACHSLDYVPFRSLRGLGYSMPEIQEFAARFRYQTVNAEGAPETRAGTPQDSFPRPFANEAQAAAAHNGVAPPDLSLMARARAALRPLGFVTDLLTDYDTAGADYIYALLTGYQNPPPAVLIAGGQYYNPYFIAGAALAMAPPLHDGQIVYNDGAPQTAAQYAKDATAFLSWAADPHREKRKKTGFAVMLFLAALAGLVYCLKREIWAKPPNKG